MKRKSTIRKPEPLAWSLEQETITESPPKQKTVNVFEQIKYERTKDFGGLVPERSPILDNLCKKVGELKHEQMPNVPPGTRPAVDSPNGSAS